jgi:neutral ceramidase
MNHWLTCFVLTIGLSTTLATAPATAAEPAPLRVGAAAVAFPVNDSMKLGGHMQPLTAAGQEGELRAVATVIEQPGSGKFAIVACDVLFITREMVDHCAALIQKSCGISREHLLVNATHTHNAPSTVRIHGTAAEPEFVAGMQDSIVKAVEQANARLTDNSRFLFHLGQEPNIGVNSRLLLPDGMISWGPTADPAARPTGPFDPELPVWVFRGPEDKLLSVIYNHSTHTVGSIRPNFRSPSFYGLAAQALETEWSAPVCFLEGASGSTHNAGRSMEYMITELKRDVTEGVERAEQREVQRIVSVLRPLRYKVRVFDEATEDKKVVDYMTAHAPGDLDPVTKIFRDARAQVKPHQGEERETWVQVMLIGDVALVGVPAEFFTLLGMEIKRRSPFPDTYVAELANDWIGYTPDREAFGLGGYQTWVGSHNWTEIGTGEAIVDAAVAILEELAKKPAAENKQ